MLNHKFKARGAIGFKREMGVDEVELDFTGKTGLIALAGPNGRGKTTLLELMSIFRILPSHKGSFARNFFLRDSYVQNTQTFNGDKYDVVRKIDSQTKLSEAFIYKNDSEKSEVNGKVTDYDKYVKDLYGSQNLFYNSVFCAQGSKNFSEMDTADIKKLFIEFLRLELLAEREEQSKAAIKFFLGKKAILDNEIELLAKSCETIPGLKVELNDIGQKRLTNIRSIDVIDEQGKGFKTEIEGLKKSAIQNETNVAREKDIATHIEKEEQALSTFTEKSAANKKTFDDRVSSLNSELAVLNEVLSSRDKIDIACKKVDSLAIKEKHFLEMVEQYSHDQQFIFSEDLPVVTSLIHDVESAMSRYNDDTILEKLSKINTDLNESLSRAQTRKQDFEKDLEAVETRPSLIEVRAEIRSSKEMIGLAIDPDCKSQTCQALLSIADVRKNLPLLLKREIEILNDIKTTKSRLLADVENLSTEIKGIEADLLKNDEGLSARNKAVAVELKKFDSLLIAHGSIKQGLESELSFVNENLEFFRESAKQRRSWIDQLSPLAAKKQGLETAESQKKVIENQVKELNTGNDANIKESQELIDQKSKDISGLKQKKQGVSDLIIADVNIKVEASERKLLDLAGDKKSLVEFLESVGKRIAVINDSLEKKNIDKVAMTEKQAVMMAINKEISDWTYLKLACSKTGLQALEIDGATPLITKEANRLLEMAFGLDFQINIITQDPESGKEIFWVKVIRGDGSEDFFGDLSGGQKVWVAKGLSLGMTLVSKHKSGKDFKTLSSDEETGALDPQKAVEFITLYRSMLETGDFDTCLFISHNPDVVAMADHVIDFSGAGPKFI